MNAPFLAAAFVGAIAPFVRAWAWGVPMGCFTWGMALRATLGAGLVTLMAGLIPLVVVDDLTAGLIGLVVGGLLMLLSARRSRHLRGIMLLSWRLASPLTRDEVVERLRGRLASARRLGPESYAQLALVAALADASSAMRTSTSSRSTKKDSTDWTTSPWAIGIALHTVRGTKSGMVACAWRGGTIHTGLRAVCGVDHGELGGRKRFCRSARKITGRRLTPFLRIIGPRTTPALPPRDTPGLYYVLRPGTQLPLAPEKAAPPPLLFGSSGKEGDQPSTAIIRALS